MTATTAPAQTPTAPAIATVWRYYQKHTYEGEAAQARPSTATVWTAHLSLDSAALVPATLAALAPHPALTGEYLHTPSYDEWSEPRKTGDSDRDHLAVYLAAPNEDEALGVALALLTLLWPMDEVSPETVVTCAGDWDWDAILTLR